MDTELFMECEEEELEPWQQVDDSVEEDEVDFTDNYCEPVEDSQSPLPASETPPPTTPVTTVSCLPARSSAPPALMAQAQPLILTQTAGGTFLLPAAPGAASGQPILLTTQGFPVMNPGAPLLLNLQPGQTVQPLTLIQSPSLGQLVRPSVAVSPVHTRPGPAPTRGPAHPSSAFAAMQLPATLAIRTSMPGPVNLQMTQVGGASSLKLAASPALPSGSANGITRTAAFSTPGAARSEVTSVRTTSALTSDPPQVVMSVEEFYYGTFNGDLSLRRPHPPGVTTSTYTCQVCLHLSDNNLRLMQHMLQHSELVGGDAGAADDGRCCRFCYRQFSCPAQLQSHQDQVHGPILSSCMCRICEWAFENEPAFLNHMKSNHKPGEMPYICQVCSFRSSFYSDVVQHFSSFHRDSRFLLCVFCLKVTRNAVSYQQHLLRHQMNQAFHCNRCRLQFVFLKDKMQHKLDNHRSFRRPAQLEGLPPGSKVTIRTYGKMRPLMTSAGKHSSLIQPIRIKTEQPRSLIQSPALGPRSPPGRPASRRVHVSRRSVCDRVVCVECGTEAADLAAHYPTHVRCLLCAYSSCCSRAYAAHMIHHHVPRSSDGGVPLHRRPPPCVFLLQCSHCDFRPLSADLMADHLLRNPEHHSAACHPQRSTKVGFLKDRISGAVEVKEVEDSVDGAMAPVEDLDFSDDEQLDDFEDLDEEFEDSKEEFHPASQLLPSPSAPAQPPTPQSARDRDDFLTARQLRIALFALCDGLRQASRIFSTDTELIRSWLKEARRRLKPSEPEQKANADGEGRMVAWVLSMREQQLSITESNLFHKASTLKKKGGFSDSFRISYDWAVSFMLQHRLGVRTVGRDASLARPLPPSLEVKIKSFREFTHKVVQANKLPADAIAAMDELCIFVDLRLVQDKSRRSEALELTGSLPLVTVYLTVLADGTMLPSLLLSSRQLAEKTRPEFVLLEVGRESLSVEEALEIWTSRVWVQHVSGPAQPSKSVLVLDRHREHLGDAFLTSVSGVGTLPAVIPGGCSLHLQPLEVCVKPVLQQFLLSRWAEFTARNPKELEETLPHRLQANVAQLLVDWVVDALTHLNKLPQLWKTSFHLTGLLPGRTEEEKEAQKKEEEKTRSQKPEETQLDLLETLTETLLRAHALDANSPKLLELEDQEDTEEEGEDKENEKEVKEDKGETREKGREETQEDTGKDDKEVRKETERDSKETEETRTGERKTLEEDSEEEGKETREDRKEASKERRETRIVIGEEVGDEWKITVKSRTEDADRMDES